MTFLIGFGILLVLVILLFIVESTAPTVHVEAPQIVGLFHLIIFICAGMFGWGAQEYVTEEWFGLSFKEGVWARVFQVFHALLFVLLAMRGFVIGLVIAMIVGAGIFVQWLIFG
ncbi:hypothetical protein [Pseudoalteromonas sp. NCIMB_1079]|uniref:hypothetical protein n=2 Tax=unclassified Pseudoalteromonas TaxID=194690 RepID=UPI00339C0A21